ncbi:uncharacterized protein LACBIDRAFT_331782 [Laccaria bicolor S238N-H82]|uniref:Predicted protein n=1 Tax=Laccaria bicolor (strain S238N-H82 / ATCC MYA-4686) TaxID=486041 RepID=B0DQJ2_LACBS|nr:uncharacterized protein LACBIDRAFT_331782 [Laccaria bicolor S238N-H82]EDR03044.1 predicted protein [Laccaria bicolor S238N-H82]|eukprot:XP_001886185.1 predicted protein [Laccaria bicolor S238N-H82]
MRKITPSKPSFDLNTAISAAESSFGGKHNGHPASVKYVALTDGSAALAHVIQIQSDEDDSWLEAMAQAMAQGFVHHEPELWALLGLDDGPRRPGFGTAGPGWLTALGRAWHITTREGRIAAAFLSMPAGRKPLPIHNC